MEEQKRADLESLLRFDDPAGSETRYRELLAEAHDPAWALEIRCVLARTYGLRGKFDEAHAQLDAIEKELKPEMHRAHVRYLLERGRVFNSSGKPDRARPLFLGAIDQAHAAHESYLEVDAIHMMAIVEPAEKQIEWGLKGIAVAEKSKDARTRRWLGALTNNLGWAYHDSKQFDKALDMFKRGVKAREEMKQPRELRIAKYAVGRCLRSMSRIDEALNLQRTIHAEAQAAAEPDPYVCEELGELLTLKHREDEAAPYFATAYQELSKDDWLVKNEPKRLERLKQMGRVK